jgi:hypothetical protein
MVNGLAWDGDEGRGKLRKAPGSRKHASIRRFPNGVQSTGAAARHPCVPRGTQTLGKETSEYQEEKKSIEIPLSRGDRTRDSPNRILARKGREL